MSLGKYAMVWWCYAAANFDLTNVGAVRRKACDVDLQQLQMRFDR